MASTAPGLQTRSSSAKTACFTAMSSNTASTTISTWLNASYAVAPVKRAITAALASALRRPLATRLS